MENKVMAFGFLTDLEYRLLLQILDSVIYADFLADDIEERISVLKDKIICTDCLFLLKR